MAIHLLGHQPRRQGAPLLHPHDEERPATAIRLQVLTERVRHVAIGELARFPGVLAQGSQAVEAGLPVARREQPTHPHERPSIVGRHHPAEQAVGRHVIHGGVPVTSPVIGGGRDKEHVHGRIAGGRRSGRSRHQEPGLAPGVVGRRGRTIDLERGLGVQAGAQDIVAPDHGRRQDQAQQDGPHSDRPAPKPQVRHDA